MRNRTVFLVMLALLLISMLDVALQFHTIFALPYTDIDVDTAYNMITGGVYPDLVVLDVRTQNEYDSGHIYGAVWIPVAELEARIGELTNHKDHELIVYCLSGGRSVTASAVLDSNNFTEVYNMVGGISAWQSAGYPVWIATVHNINTTFNYDTIQAAIDAPQTLNGHTILVDAGTYYENVVVNKTVSLVGENKSNTIIDGIGGRDVIHITVSNVNVSRCTMRNGPRFGLWVGSPNCLIDENIILNNSVGIIIYFTGNCRVQSNIVANSSDCGIDLLCSGENVLRNNSLFDNEHNFGVAGFMLYHYLNDIDVSNTINGKPIYYLINQQNLVIDPSTFQDVGYLGLINSTNVIIENLNITHNMDGVLLAYTMNSKIENLYVSNNGFGISLDDCSNCTIIGNTVENNGDGICVIHSDNIAIIRNNANNNWRGMYLDGEHYRVVKNDISNNGIGINSWDLNHSIIYHNNVIHNGVYLSHSYNNTWDNGCEGNYWSDYTEPDVESPYGIVDNPYVIDENNTDNYPLTCPYEYWSNPIEGDINKDTEVDWKDLLILAMAYGSEEGEESYVPEADFNSDGEIDWKDLLVLAQNYGES